MENTLQVGDKVRFSSEVRPYTVKAVGGQFAICTKPLNVLKTVLYTIIDFKEEVRGPNDLVFNMYDYTVQAEIDECMADLTSEDSILGISRRRQVYLDIVSVNKKPYPNV